MPACARRPCKAEVRMKTKAHRERALGTCDHRSLTLETTVERALGTCDHRRFKGEAFGAKRRRQLDAVAKREDGKEITARPLEPGRQEVLSRFSYYPTEQRPWHT